MNDLTRQNAIQHVYSNTNEELTDLCSALLRCGLRLSSIECESLTGTEVIKFGTYGASGKIDWTIRGKEQPK